MKTRKQWDFNQPIKVANSRITYPLGDYRRSLLSSSLDLNITNRNKSIEIKKALSSSLTLSSPSLIQEFSENDLRNIWIQTWYSKQSDCLCWIYNLNERDIEICYYCPILNYIILASTIDQLGLIPYTTTSKISRRHSWSEKNIYQTITTNKMSKISNKSSNKENYDEKWIICYISSLFDNHLSHQKIYFWPEEAQQDGINNIIPIFLLESDFDTNLAHFVPTELIHFRLSSKSSKKQIIVDCAGENISVQFTPKGQTITNNNKLNTIIQKPKKDKNILKLKTVFNSSSPSSTTNTDNKILPPPIISPIFQCLIHFHSIQDLNIFEERLNSIKDNSNFSTYTLSIKDWISILNNDSCLLLQELYLILLRSIELKGNNLEISKLVIKIILNCWDMYLISGAEINCTNLLFYQLITALGTICSTTIDIIYPYTKIIDKLVKNGLFNQVNLLTIEESLYQTYQSSIETIFLSFFSLISSTHSSVDSSSTELISILTNIWFVNLFNSLQLNKNNNHICIEFVFISSLQIKDYLKSTNKSLLWYEIFGITLEFQSNEIFHIIFLNLVNWLEIFLDTIGGYSTTLNINQDKNFKNEEFMINSLMSLRFINILLCFYIIIYQYKSLNDNDNNNNNNNNNIINNNNNQLNYIPEWNIIYKCLQFLQLSQNLLHQTYKVIYLVNMIQIVELLNLIFVEAKWLRQKDYSSIYRDVILQILEECVESIDRFDESDMITSSTENESISIDQLREIYSCKLISLLSACYEYDGFQVSNSKQYQQNQNKTQNIQESNKQSIKFRNDHI